MGIDQKETVVHRKKKKRGEGIRQFVNEIQ
jgi:hypothetical protein